MDQNHFGLPSSFMWACVGSGQWCVYHYEFGNQRVSVLSFILKIGQGQLCTVAVSKANLWCTGNPQIHTWGLLLSSTSSWRVFLVIVCCAWFSSVLIVLLITTYSCSASGSSFPKTSIAKALTQIFGTILAIIFASLSPFRFKYFGCSGKISSFHSTCKIKAKLQRPGLTL